MELLYKGPSVIDGAPIVVLATGIKAPSTNTKTGPMIQTYILREDISPTEAVKTEADESICGDCIHRGEDGGKRRTCYVLVHQGPTSIWKAYHRNIKTIQANRRSPENIGKNKIIRLGAYGDPGAAPTNVWAELLTSAAEHTGYTHLWRTCDQALSTWCMASVESVEEKEEAQKAGWRTYRVMQEHEKRLCGEAQCPASEEAGKKLTCAECTMCDGNKRNRKGSIGVYIHGANWKKQAFDEIRNRNTVLPPSDMRGLEDIQQPRAS